MKTEILKEGLVFKNYKAMCLELEIEQKTGKSRQLQLKDLQRYFTFTKQGNKYIVNEVYPMPLPKEDNRGKKSKYGEMIQLLILDLLAQRKSNSVTYSRSGLLKTINMINENYGFCGDNVRRLSVYTKIDEKVIYDFYNSNNSNFKSTVETALNNLVDKRIIRYEIVTKVSLKGSRTNRLATEEEKDVIMDIEKHVLDELGYKLFSEVRVSKDWKKFKKRTKALLNFQSEIDFYYSAYKISVNEKYIENERKELLEYLLEKEERSGLKGELNATICNSIVENAQKRHENGFTSGKLSKIRLDKNYVNDIKRLAELLIDDYTPSFITEMLKDEGVQISDELESLINSDIDNALDELFA